MSLPRAALAMDARTHGWLVTPATRAELTGLLDIDPDQFLVEFGSDRSRAVLRDVEVLVTGWGSPVLDADALLAAPQLSAVFHAAGSVKGHLTLAVWDREVVVVSAASAGAAPVAEFTLATILYTNKSILQSGQLFHRDRTMAVQELLPADRGNLGRTVGLVGASRIGRRVAELLRPFDLSVLVYDPYLLDTEAGELGVEQVDLTELMGRSDIVSIHAPSTPATRHMIGAAELALMRDGATLLNTARGALVDHDALRETLRTGRIWAVLDVTDPEPLPPDDLLWDLPNVMLTPHVSGAFNPRESHRHLALALDELRRWQQGLPLQHRVERSALDVMA